MAGFKQVGLIIEEYKKDEGSPFAEATEGHGKQRRISREWQDFAYRLALELDDLAHTSLYMKMCKDYPRGVLEEARSFVADSNAKSKGKLFMWKVKEIRDRSLSSLGS